MTDIVDIDIMRLSKSLNLAATFFTIYSKILH